MRAAASTGSSDNHLPLQLRFVSERFFAWTFAGTPLETAEAYPDDIIDDCWIAECWGGGGGRGRLEIHCLLLAIGAYGSQAGQDLTCHDANQQTLTFKCYSLQVILLESFRA